MDYQYREIRKADIPEALAFAKAQGIDIAEYDLRHNLSLLVKAEGEVVGAALCVESDPGHHRVHLSATAAEGSEDLARQLADRALRKLQADGIGATRLTGSEADAEAVLWQQTNWLDRIAVVTPLGMDGGAGSGETASATPESEPAQAA